MNKILYYLIAFVLLSWIFPIPYISKLTSKFKPKALKPSLILLLGFVGGSIASDIRENREIPATYTTVWLSRLINVLTFGFVRI